MIVRSRRHASAALCWCHRVSLRRRNNRSLLGQGGHWSRVLWSRARAEFNRIGSRVPWNGIRECKAAHRYAAGSLPPKALTELSPDQLACRRLFDHWIERKVTPSMRRERLPTSPVKVQSSYRRGKCPTLAFVPPRATHNCRAVGTLAESGHLAGGQLDGGYRRVVTGAEISAERELCG